MKAKFIEVESELSAMVAVQGRASLAPAYSRNLSPPLLHAPPMIECADLPWSWGVHRSNKSMQRTTPTHGAEGQRWIQLYCEDNQEALDTALMSYKIAEDPRLSTPTIFV